MGSARVWVIQLHCFMRSAACGCVGACSRCGVGPDVVGWEVGWPVLLQVNVLGCLEPWAGL